MNKKNSYSYIQAENEMLKQQEKRYKRLLHFLELMFFIGWVSGTVALVIASSDWNNIFGFTVVFFFVSFLLMLWVEANEESAD